MKGRRGRKVEGREGGREIEREVLRRTGREKGWREAQGTADAKALSWEDPSSA